MAASRLVGISWFNLRFFGLAMIGISVVTLPAQAALNAYMKITADGSAIDGETTLVEIAGIDVSTDYIECYAVHQEIFKDVSGGTGQESHTPIKIIKRVDKASPLLYMAFGQNQTIEGVIQYFKPDPDSGTTIKYVDLVITGGRIAGIRHWQPNTLDPNANALPLMEEVSITYDSLEIIDLSSGTSYVLNAPVK